MKCMNAKCIETKYKIVKLSDCNANLVPVIKQLIMLEGRYFMLEKISLLIFTKKSLDFLKIFSLLDK